MIVKVINQDGMSALVQWVDDGELKRGIIPVSSLRGDVVTKRELNRAAPYGEPWEELVELKATGEDLARNLRKAGIWTAKDLQSNPTIIQSVLMATYGVDYNTLVRIAYGGAK